MDERRQLLALVVFVAEVGREQQNVEVAAGQRVARAAAGGHARQRKGRSHVLGRVQQLELRKDARLYEQRGNERVDS